MKKSLFFILAVLFSLSSWGQNNAKLSSDLQKELNNRTNASEQFRVLIVMAEEYDQVQMTRQIQYMEKAERRAFVINELQQFSRASQNDLMQVLNEGANNGLVHELTPFWISNTICCTMTRDMINAISLRNDILIIESDEYRNMLPGGETRSEISNQEPGASGNTSATRGTAWHVTQVNADDVWTYNGASGYNGSGIVVAVLDTGVKLTHNDIKNHLWTNSQGYHGYDYVNNDNDPTDDNGHGSHCAGIVAGDGSSGTKTGMAPGAQIMAVKVLGANGSGDLNNIQSGIQYAITNGADIVSMSLGSSGTGVVYVYRQSFANMLNAGIIAAISAGNDGEDYGSYPIPNNIGAPGNCPPPWQNPDQTLSGGASAVVCVGSSQRNDRKSTFSSIGPVTWASGTYHGNYTDYPYSAGSSTNIGLIRPDIAVPGSDITSLKYNSTNGYTVMCGTSMAAPGCAGIMALMLSANPSLTPSQIDEILETTAIPCDFQTSKNNNTGAGRADALAAIDAIFTTATKPTNLNLTVCGGDVNLTWTASTAPAGYCIYRDNVQVATNVSGTTYTDSNVGMGKHIYYVRANDSNNHQSVHSNCVVCTIEPYATTPSLLIGILTNNYVELSWAESADCNYPSQSTTINFVNSYSTAFGGSSAGTHIGGIKYLPEQIGQYKGMSIDKISFYVNVTGITYTLRIYRGTTHGNTTGAPVVTKTFSASSRGWVDITLNTPYALDDVSQDLWITVGATTTGSGYPLSVGSFTGPSSECLYTATNSDANNLIWTHIPDGGDHYALCLKTHLTRTTTYTPTYTVYNNGNSIAQNLTLPLYTDYNPTSFNSYYVTGNVGNNESCPSDAFNLNLGDIDIMATANPIEGGTITGTGSYLEGSTATLTATPNLGYAFVNWTENGHVYSTDPTISIIALEPRNFVANFQVIQPNVITYANVENGTVSGPTAAYPGEFITLTATPAENYVFGTWKVTKTNDPSISILVIDNQFMMPNYDVTVAASFVENPEHDITVACGIRHGSVTTGLTAAEPGVTVTVTATPSSGDYVFENVVVFNTANPDELVYFNRGTMSFKMPDFDVTVSASFVLDVAGYYQYAVGTNDDVNASGNLPTKVASKYSLSQCIYKPSQLGGLSGKIIGMAYYSSSTTSTTRSNVDVYMSTTNTNSFSSDKAWIRQSDSNKVFSGSWEIDGEGWQVIAFDNYFEYNGTSNLLVTFDDNSNATATAQNFYTFAGVSNNTLFYSSNNTNLNPTSSLSQNGSRTSALPVVIFLVLNETEYDSDEAIAVSPCELSGLDYAFSEGPSAAQFVNVIGSHLGTPVQVTAPTHFEVSKNPNGPFSSSLYLADEWMHYDNGEFATAIGAGGTLYWGSMFPSSYLPAYVGGSLTKVALFTNSSTTGSYTLNIYTEGDTAPQTLVHTQTFTPGTNEGLTEIGLTNPITIDASKNLWITFYQTGTDYPACACTDMGIANNRWTSTNGTSWFDLNQTSLSGYSWIVRGYVDMGAKGGELVELPAFKGNQGGELSKSMATVINRDVITYDFENGTQGWTTLDKDGDGHNWFMNSEYEANCLNNQPVAHSGSACWVSMSYDNCYRSAALTPENYLISPEVELGGSVTFYAAEANSEYGPEVIGVYVSTAANPSQFTQVGEDINISNTDYELYTIDLSSFSGRGHVAICHHNCTDVFFMVIDDITIYPAGYEPPTPTPVLPTGYQITKIYTRLKAGLPIGQYNNETLTLTSGEASAEVSLSGEVIEALHIVPDNQTVNGDLVLGQNNRYLITSTGILTVNGTITCDNWDWLVIEDGGQLYCSSSNVQATFHKTIAKTTDDTDGWYTIAAPMYNPITLRLTANTYDIYAYDEDADQEEWKNFRTEPFIFLPGHGYLYANSAATGEESTDLVMLGVLTPSNTPIEVNLSYAASHENIRGYNLIGNPYPHNISMSDVKVNGEAITEFYRLSNGSQLERFTSGEILPGESFFIKATAAGQKVVIGGE